MNNKSLLTKVCAAAFIALMLLPMVYASGEEVEANVWTDPSDWYMTVKGDLSTDYYLLYPFEKSDLKIGF
ncbi:MAG: hypothetical protein QXL67_05175, partial [Candidatus Bathyarchaeia archaeon]